MTAARKIIMQHYRSPKYKKDLTESGLRQHENPACGDWITLKIEKRQTNNLLSVHFDGRGCSLSIASASILCTMINGKSENDAREIAEQFTGLFQTEADTAEFEKLGDLSCFSEIAKLPVRQKCVLLPWKALLTELTDP